MLVRSPFCPEPRASEEPYFAARLVQQHPDTARAALQRSYLTPLLASQKRGARLIALTFLGDLDPEMPASREKDGILKES